MQSAPLLSTVGAVDALAQVFAYVLGTIVMLYAVARLVRCPSTSLWSGRISKAGLGMLTLWIVVRLGGVTLPLGAMIFLSHIHKVARCAAGKTTVLANNVTGTDPERAE